MKGTIILVVRLYVGYALGNRSVRWRSSTVAL